MWILASVCDWRLGAFIFLFILPSSTAFAFKIAIRRRNGSRDNDASCRAADGFDWRLCLGPPGCVLVCRSIHFFSLLLTRSTRRKTKSSRDSVAPHSGIWQTATRVYGRGAGVKWRGWLRGGADGPPLTGGQQVWVAGEDEASRRQLPRQSRVSSCLLHVEFLHQRRNECYRRHLTRSARGRVYTRHLRLMFIPSFRQFWKWIWGKLFLSDVDHSVCVCVLCLKPLHQFVWFEVLSRFTLYLYASLVPCVLTWSVATAPRLFRKHTSHSKKHNGSLKWSVVRS